MPQAPTSETLQYIPHEFAKPKELGRSLPPRGQKNPKGPYPRIPNFFPVDRKVHFFQQRDNPLPSNLEKSFQLSLPLLLSPKGE